MKSALKALSAAIMTLALSLSLAPAALAHGGVPDGHAEPGGRWEPFCYRPSSYSGASPSSAFSQ